jgi:hypothetical protein
MIIRMIERPAGGRAPRPAGRQGLPVSCRVAPSLPWIGGQAPCYPSSPQVAQHRECRSYVLSFRPAATLDGRAAAFDRGRPVALAGLDPVAATVRCPPGPAPGHRLRAVGRPGFAVVGDHPEAAAGQRGEGFGVVGRSGHASRVLPAQPPAAAAPLPPRGAMNLTMPRVAAATPGSRGPHAPERCATRRSRRSNASVRAAISWTTPRPRSAWPLPARGPCGTARSPTSATRSARRRPGRPRSRLGC